MKRDIETIDDVKCLVDTFYGKVNEDTLLDPVFNNEAAVDWESHLPKMYKFWSTQLIGTMDYKGSPFPPHTKLNIDETHFKRWLLLFEKTVKENFEGKTADSAIQKANNIASLFNHKLSVLRKK